MKKYLITLAIFSLVFTGCDQSGEKEIDVELVPYSSGEYWGYFDGKGQVKINPQFRQAYLYSEGLALIQAPDLKYGFINKEGKIVINPIYKYAGCFSEGLAAVAKEDNKIEYINQKGKTEITLDGGIERAGGYKEGMAIVYADGLYGFIDRSGKIVVPLQYEGVGEFHEGLASVRSKDATGDGLNLFGFIDKTGKLVIPFQFEICGDFSEGLAKIYNAGKCGYIDKEGKYVINPQFDDARDFKDGKAVIKDGDLYGFIDKSGSYVINPQFKSAGHFYDGIACVANTDMKYGYIDENGKFQVNPQYDFASRFYTDKALARLGKKYGLIDKKGKFIVNPQYEAIQLATGSGQMTYSDYVDLNSIVQPMLGTSSTINFKGLSPASTFQMAKSIYPALNKDNYYDLQKHNEKGNGYFQLYRVALSFEAGLLTQRAVYKEQQAYDSYNGTYVTQQVYDGVEYVLNEHARVIHSRYTYHLFGKAAAKKDNIMQELIAFTKNNLQMTAVSGDQVGTLLYHAKNATYAISINMEQNSGSVQEIHIDVTFPGNAIKTVDTTTYALDTVPDGH